MAAVLKYWREAASLILISPSTHHSASKAPRMGKILHHKPQLSTVWHSNPSENNDVIQPPDFETLLLKRSGKSKFMPSVYVFPGGTADDADFSADWISVFQKVGERFQKLMFEKVTRNNSKACSMFTRQRDPQFSTIPPEVAFRICAIRETFEESGILIAKTVDELLSQEKLDTLLSTEQNVSSSMTVHTDNRLAEWRKHVDKDPLNFVKMCMEMNVIPDILSLYEWTCWLTPTIMGGKRFDTIFYICSLGSKPEAKEDEKETVHHQWVSPLDMMADYYQNEEATGLATPQVYELTRLLNFSKADELMMFAAEREIERVQQFFPVLVFADDYIMGLMPGDDLYPIEPDFITPKKMIKYDKPMEELDKDTKNYHRTVTDMLKAGNGLVWVLINIAFKNKHIGPVMVKAQKEAKL